MSVPHSGCRKAISLKTILTVNLAKNEFGHATVTYLGYVVGQGKVAPVEAEVQAILGYPVPSAKKALRWFFRNGGVLS